MDIGKPRRKYTIEPIKNPLKRERDDEPAPKPAPVREAPEHVDGRM